MDFIPATRKRSRSSEEEDFLPLSKKINNLHINQLQPDNSNHHWISNQPNYPTMPLQQHHLGHLVPQLLSAQQDHLSRFEPELSQQLHLSSFTPQQPHLTSFGPELSQQQPHLTPFAPGLSQQQPHLTPFAPGLSQQQPHLATFASELSQQQHMSPYAPELSPQENPFYYENNKVLYELYVARAHRAAHQGFM